MWLPIVHILPLSHPLHKPHTYICTYINTYIYIHSYIHAYICMHMYIHMLYTYLAACSKLLSSFATSYVFMLLTIYQSITEAKLLYITVKITTHYNQNISESIKRMPAYSYNL